MSIASQRGPLGQKTPRAEKRKSAALPPVSKKRAAYKASAAGAAGRAHMARVAALPCLACGAMPVEVHHLHGHGFPRSDMRVIPLCPQHHRREFGAGAYHYSPSAFQAAHGDIPTLLAWVDRAIKNA